MTCKEHDFSQVASILAVPVGTLDFYSPVFATTPYADAKDFSVPQDAIQIKFNRDTIKCSDKNSTGVHGFVHEVSLEWDFVYQDAKDYDDLVTLQYLAHEFIINYFGGAQKVIRTDETAYMFLFNDDNGVMKCSATLNNGQGLTSIISNP